MSQPNPKIDGFMRKASPWQNEYNALRKIALTSGLTEEVKWRWPCYTLGGKNVVLIHGFKNYCALMFFKGGLLKDPKHILIKPTENMHSARQARFTSVQEIAKVASALKAYIREAAAVEKSGVKMPKREMSEFPVPDEFKQKLNKLPSLKTAFHAPDSWRQPRIPPLFLCSQASQDPRGADRKMAAAHLGWEGFGGLNPAAPVPCIPHAGCREAKPPFFTRRQCRKSRACGMDEVTLPSAPAK